MPTLSPEAAARLASPAVVAALALLADLTRESLIQHAADLIAGDVYTASTAIGQAAHYLSGEIALFVGCGYPMGNIVPSVAFDGTALNIACDLARRDAHRRLVAVLADVAPAQVAA